MKKMSMLFLLTIMTGFALSACGSAAAPTDEYIYGQDATVESLEVILMESFPVQVNVGVSGYLPDGCTELYQVTSERDGQQFVLTIETRRPSGDIACSQALVPFTETVSLEVLGLDAGTYTIIAQDQETTFTLDVDNVIE
jgi:inhibitor of cysteine peptidase